MVLSDLIPLWKGEGLDRGDIEWDSEIQNRAELGKKQNKSDFADKWSA